MKNISSNAELQVAIQLLEAEQANKLRLMKIQFHLAYENLKPVNLIESTLKEISTSPYLLNNLLSASVGLLTGYVSNKAFTRNSTNKFRKFLGIVMQFGVTNLIAQNPRMMKSFGQFISQRIFNKEN